jgi:hypothetical protein
VKTYSYGPTPTHIDERAVKEAIRTGAREIPGLEIFEELSIVGRA